MARQISMTTGRKSGETTCDTEVTSQLPANVANLARWTFISRVYQALFSAVIVTVTSGIVTSLIANPSLLPLILIGSLVSTAVIGLSLPHVSKIPGINAVMFYAFAVAEG